MEECIHGLEAGLCDLCYPKAAPQPIQVARQPRAATASARSPRPTRGGVSTGSTRGGLSAGSTRASQPSSSKRSVIASQQRIYHVTHVRNLEAILDSGELRAGATPVVDLSTALTRELRATVELPAAAKPVAGAVASVASHVAFYLSPDATPWSDLRSGVSDEVRWTTAARTAATSDFVVLVSTIGAVGDVTVTDGDAAGTHARFFTGDAVQRAVERAYDSDTIRLGAEVLAGDSVDFATIQLIGVANDPARDRVRELVAAAGFTTKVSVYPPWFQPGVASVDQ